MAEHKLLRAARRGRCHSSLGVLQACSLLLCPRLQGRRIVGGSPGGSFHLDQAGPAGGVGGGHQLCQAIAVAGAAGEEQFALGGEFEEGAVGEVGAGAVELTRRQAHWYHRWLRGSLGRGNERANRQRWS